MKTVNLRTVLILSFQLVIIIVLVSIGTMYISKLSKHSSVTTKDNLRSVKYCSAMQKALYGLKYNPDQLSLRTEFENNLKLELENITESGEKELANKIQADYFLWLKIPEESTFTNIINYINEINNLNILDIENRNAEEEAIASSGKNSIIIIGFFGALAAFIFTFAFIGFLIRPK